ncbi:Hypothetical protein I595_675 [Croceitalea dokdonensis DOKDO 023]|uniref:Lipoprotein n=1 Tax=Croceitalea dokdonensis DOKDO 023 TaxID=1300341 RepID=A0A0P7AJG9_9FLAO|nr:hypothetical protein [Croceitalea dokdonensis]KPM33769.1 Hypothetical protein I595_675 [Croceitalea dokdonensis DOKDO 023]
MVRCCLVIMVILLGACETVSKKPKTKPAVKNLTSFDKVDVIPKPAILNDSLSASFVKLINRHQDQFVVSKVVITSPDWSNSFNEHGHVESRYRTVSAFSTSANNQCLLKELVLQEEYQQGAFKAPKVIEEKPWKLFDCRLRQKRNPGTVAGVNLKE